MQQRPQQNIGMLSASSSRAAVTKHKQLMLMPSFHSNRTGHRPSAATRGDDTTPRNRRDVFPPSMKAASEYWSSMVAWGAHTLTFLRSVVRAVPQADDTRVPPSVPTTAVSPDGYWVIREGRKGDGGQSSRPTYGTMVLPDPESGVYERFVMAFVRKEDAEATLAPLRSSVATDAEVEHVCWRDLSVATCNSLGIAVFQTDAMRSCGEHPCRIIRRTTTEDVSADRDTANSITAALNRCLSA